MLIVHDPTFHTAMDAAHAHFAGGFLRAFRRTARRIGIGGWLATAAVVLPSCYFAYSSLMPRLHVFVSVDQEAALGEAAYEMLTASHKPLEDAELAGVISRMVQELRDPTSDYDLRVVLLDDDEVNAYALPGGRIVIYTGLLKKAPSADALAGVLAHEISHVEGRHSLKHILRALGLTQFAFSAVGGSLDGFEVAEMIVELSSGLIVLKNSREHERHADMMAIDKLRAAGRSACGLIEIFDIFRKGGGDLPKVMRWMSTHPLSEARIERVRALTRDDVPGQPWMSREEWGALRKRL
jgi:predicted Zn-dependent protease